MSSVGAFCSVFFVAPSVVAEPPKATPTVDDGAYGRLDGDVALDLSLGTRLALSPPDPAAFNARLGALYVATVGTFVSLDRGAHAHDKLGTSLGVEVRPLFIPRFVSAGQTGPAWLDLVIDSFSLALASRWVGNHSAALELSTGVELPLFAAYAGPLIAVRLSQVLGQSSLRGGDPHDRQTGVDGTFLSISFGWRASFSTHIVDARDKNIP